MLLACSQNSRYTSILEPEVDDELIVLEEIVPGNSGVTVAIPSETENRNVKKRKQPPITDYFMKKHINKK